MEPISELVDRTDGSQISLLALLQILYEIEQCEKERKAIQNIKNTPSNKGGKDTDKKKQQSKSPPTGKTTSTRKKSPEGGKTKLKKTKAVRDLIDAAKGTQSKDDQQIDEDEQERTLEELLEDLCFLLLTDPQIVRIDISIYFFKFIILIARKN
jgi:hypothetical protein